MDGERGRIDSTRCGPGFLIHCIEQDPGAPPQRPQVGAPPLLEDLLESATANTESVLAVFIDPHSGHGIFAPLVIDFTSFSNCFSQDWQMYS